ncbi:hypothetical protein D8T49_21660 [Vibrio vulnificus]|nr:hypothetical protein [Vibrio vulnificus]EGR7964352.1 hypothetical protein [Vibrio vulnificus]EHY0959466.1 hypothetical protein [Vibrio vulnificus]EHZ7360140.1 hypothetical protein [Vibrio vulnificus]MCU8150627.1 hypothetical protein [Vibrio vulnificus]MCU8190330.1 hypothetical protein [Vibrio vulnificus]
MNKFVVSLYRKASTDPKLSHFKGTTERLVRYLNSDKANIDFSSYNIFEDELFEFVKLVTHTPTTFHKIIITDNTNEYLPFIDDLNRSSVTLLSSKDYIKSKTDNRIFNFSHDQLTRDIFKSCRLLAASKATKIEDEYNDYVRDLLKMVGYIVHDQTRSGRSQNSFTNLGELDLSIESSGQDVSIIEALRATGMNRSNIESHYKKLIDNYNPLRLPQTHLITYYYDSNNFSSFKDNYLGYISKLDGSSMSDTKSIILGNLSECDTGEGDAIFAFKQMISVDDQPCSCTHTLVNLSG